MDVMDIMDIDTDGIVTTDQDTVGIVTIDHTDTDITHAAMATDILNVATMDGIEVTVIIGDTKHDVVPLLVPTETGIEMEIAVEEVAEDVVDCQDIQFLTGPGSIGPRVFVF